MACRDRFETKRNTDAIQETRMKENCPHCKVHHGHRAKCPVQLFALRTPDERRQAARKIIKALLDAGWENAEAEASANAKGLKQAERMIDRAIRKAWKEILCETFPKTEDPVAMIYMEVENNENDRPKVRD
jgi:hypothetical protein